MPTVTDKHVLPYMFFYEYFNAHSDKIKMASTFLGSTEFADYRSQDILVLNQKPSLPFYIRLFRRPQNPFTVPDISLTNGEYGYLVSKDMVTKIGTFGFGDDGNTATVTIFDRYFDDYASQIIEVLKGYEQAMEKTERPKKVAIIREKIAA